VLCFVYCEWIDDERLKAAMPGARLVSQVTLADHRLAFTSFTEDGSATRHQGGCHLEAAPGYSVPGLLYEFDRGEVQTAESLSRVAEGRYTAAEYVVTGPDGRNYTATAYVIKHPDGHTGPSAEYRAHMLRGARQHGFPPEYLTLLESI
jgi:AIG2-like family